MATSQTGVTLLEITLVVAILAVIAAVTVPFLSSVDPSKLDFATSEIVAALRYAQADAQRSGEEHGVKAETANQLLRVYWLDTSGPIPVAIYNIRHPVDKRFYTLNFASDTQFVGVTLVDSKFIYQGSATEHEFVVFLPSGHPVYNDAGTNRLLVSGTMVLEYRGQQRVIQVAPISGRVKVL